MTPSKKNQQGFTLIELSIVLVIIGLIVGGVLVGQDLIKAAEQRALISQIEKYNSAVNTFRGKYNGVPGDLAQQQAASFGLFQLTSANALGQGDGNGLIEGGNTSGSAAPVGEVLTFWRHLSDASLVDGSYGVVGPSLITAAGATTGAVTEVSRSLPLAKLGPAGFVTVYSVSGLNYYHVIPMTGIAAGAFGGTATASGMTPTQAYNIDAKLDDGSPLTGIVMARSVDATTLNGVPGATALPSANAVTTAATCTVGTGVNTDTYNRVAATGGNDPSCSLRFRFN